MKARYFMSVMVAVAMAHAGGCDTGKAQPGWAMFAGREAPATAARPAHWAQPISSYGIANFFEVSPQLYRGSEPTRPGMEQLAGLGVKTVINMRTWDMHSTDDRMTGLGMRYVQIRMKAWEPTDAAIVEFLRIVSDPHGGPYYVHCYTGGDRAGLMAAIYRVAIQGWTKDEAIREMTYGGFTYHSIFDRWYPQYIQQMNVPEMRRLAGISPQTPTPGDVRLAAGQQQGPGMGTIAEQGK